MADPKKASFFQMIQGFGMMMFGLVIVFTLWLKGGKFVDIGVVESIGQILGGAFGALCVYFGGEQFINTLTAVGEQGNANRSTLIIIAFFLLILVVVVFGTILVLK
jgi:hypothetical protein